MMKYLYKISNDFYEILNFPKIRIVHTDKRIKMDCDFAEKTICVDFMLEEVWEI